jgi:hypothetical protein
MKILTDAIEGALAVFVVPLMLCLALVLWPTAAWPQAAGPYRFHPLGYCQITSLSSAVALVTASCSTGSVATQATIAEVCVSVASIRYRDDGTAPTTTLGVPVGAGVCFPYSISEGGMSALQMIQQTAGAIVDILFYN